jgi:hypothetical protein
MALCKRVIQHNMVSAANRGIPIAIINKVKRFLLKGFQKHWDPFLFAKIWQ